VRLKALRKKLHKLFCKNGEGIKMNRLVEVYAGAYASGKSEISINRAIKLAEKAPVILVDMDTVEPAYTLRPLKKQIEELGDITVITQEDYFGLGETGNTIKPQQQNCLSNDGTVVIDVGYGAGGLDILEILNGIENEKNMKIYIVINTAKFETRDVESIVEYVKWSKGSGNAKSLWKKFTGIISNTHLSYETTAEDVLRGYKITKEAAEQLELPIVAVTLSEELLDKINPSDIDNTEIWTLKRYMPKALW
jgi:hypothetical protein